MLRANTAVALVLVAVLVVALVAVLAGMRAARNQARAEDAEAAARERLWNAYLAEAKAVRTSREPGRRESALTVISNAAALQTSAALRTEAIASLALSDLVEEGNLLPVARDLTTYNFDAKLRHYAYGDKLGNVMVGGFVERTNLFTLRIPDPGAGTRMGVVNVSFSPDCKRLAARFADGAVAVWDLETRKLLTAIHPLATNSILSDLAFSPDSQRIVFTDVEDGSQLSVFEANTGRKLSSGAQVGRSLFSLRPDGKQVAKVARGGVELQDYPMGTNRQILKHFSSVYVLAWSPDGNLLATSCADGDVYLWDLKHDTHRILQGHTERGIWLGFSADGTRLFASSLDGTTRLWQVPEVNTIAIGEGIGRTISEDGSRLGYALPLTGFGTWRLLTNANYQLLTCTSSEGPLLTLDLSISGRWCVTTQNKGFEIWNLQGAGPPSVTNLPETYCVLVSVDERSLILGRESGLEIWRLSTNAGVEAALQPLSKKSIPLPDARGARSVALSLDGHSAAVELTDRRMVVIDLDGEQAPIFLKGRWPQVYLFKGPASVTGAGRFAISPDGRWVVTGYDFGGDLVPRVWDAHTGDLVTNLNADTSVVTFSPDGRWLGLAGTDQYSIWSVGDWRQKAKYQRDESSYVHGTMAFGREGGLFAVASGRQKVQLRSLLTEEKYFDLIGPEPQSVKSVRMSLDGSVLVTATGNNMVEVWHLDRLNHELAGMNLAWQEPSTSRSVLGAAIRPRSGGLRATLALSLAGVLLAGVFAVLILRQHRASIARFIRAEAETSQSNRELDFAKVELLHSQKMQALGTLATGIAHDFNNLLSVVRMSNKLIGRQVPGDAEIQEHVTDIEQAVLQGKGVVSSMLGYARDRDGDGEPVDVNSVVEDVVSLLSKEFLRGIRLDLQLERETPKVNIGRGALEQILLNLVVNASEAMQGEGRLKIVAHARQSLQPRPYVLRPHQVPRYVELSVIDSGPGIAPEICDRLFEPFFTTKRSGSKVGTGLGLSTVYAIAQKWELGLSVESEPGKGAMFTLMIPVEAMPVRQTHSVKISNTG
jgi:signal transduction histidine kinase